MMGLPLFLEMGMSVSLFCSYLIIVLLALLCRKGCIIGCLKVKSGAEYRLSGIDDTKDAQYSSE